MEYINVILYIFSKLWQFSRNSHFTFANLSKYIFLLIYIDSINNHYYSNRKTMWPYRMTLTSFFLVNKLLEHTYQCHVVKVHRNNPLIKHRISSLPGCNGPNFKSEWLRKKKGTEPTTYSTRAIIINWYTMEYIWWQNFA